MKCLSACRYVYAGLLVALLVARKGSGVLRPLWVDEHVLLQLLASYAATAITLVFGIKMDAGQHVLPSSLLPILASVATTLSPRISVLILGLLSCIQYAFETRGSASAQLARAGAAICVSSQRHSWSVACAAIFIGEWAIGFFGASVDPVVAVGSINPTKVLAVRQAIQNYIARATVLAVAVESGVPEQPIGLAAIAKGATSRAEAAFAAAPDPTLAFGIESGLFAPLPDRQSLYDVCIVSAFDGRSHSLGLSCAFEIPPAARDAVLKDGLDLSQAAIKVKLTQNQNIGKSGGLIAILTY